jgi:hypothetical protein
MWSKQPSEPAKWSESGLPTPPKLMLHLHLVSLACNRGDTVSCHPTGEILSGQIVAASDFEHET